MGFLKFYKQAKRGIEKLFNEMADDTVIEEICHYLAQIGFETIPIPRRSSDDIETAEGRSLGCISIKGKHLDALQLYVVTSKGSSYDVTRIAYYIDYLLKLDFKEIGRRNLRELEARTVFRSVGPVFRRRLQGFKWMAGRPTLLLWKESSSELTDSLNGDTGLVNRLMEDFEKQQEDQGMHWSKGYGAWGIVCDPIRIEADWKGACVRIKARKGVSKATTLPSILPSCELMESLDRIGYHIRNRADSLISTK